MIRTHRAFSWLDRVAELGSDPASDEGLIFRWVRLNSLYGRWDDATGRPEEDRVSWSSFLDRIMELDVDGRICGMLVEHKRLVMSVFKDAFLTKYFWEAPSQQRIRKSQKTKHDADTWYQQDQYRLILQRVTERIYFLRCQLVHGGATSRSRLNRTAVKRCSIMLGHLVTAILLVTIDHGSDEDWGPLCYPPLTPNSLP